MHGTAAPCFLSLRGATYSCPHRLTQPSVPSQKEVVEPASSSSRGDRVWNDKMHSLGHKWTCGNGGVPGMWSPCFCRLKETLLAGCPFDLWTCHGSLVKPILCCEGERGAACNSLAPRDFLPSPGPPFISSASLFGTIVPALFGNWKPHII